MIPTHWHRVVLLVTASLCVLLVLRAIHWYPLLPDRFPIHFNAAGEADGWARKSPVTWGLLPCVALSVVSGMILLARSIRSIAKHSPNLINLPNKARFLMLADHQRIAVTRPLAIYLRGVSLLMAALFLYIVEGIGRVATGGSATHPSWPVLVFVVGVIGGLPLLVRATNKAMRSHAQ
jgi:uncharacterized membrane protein